MHPQPILATALSLLTAPTTAIITGFAVPRTLAPGSTVPITITTANYIQSVQDVAMAFGLAPNAAIANTSLGPVLVEEKFLGPAESNILTNISHTVTIPASQTKGQVYFTAALYSLLGAVHQPSLVGYSAAVTVGDETSDELVRSTWTRSVAF